MTVPRLLPHSLPHCHTLTYSSAVTPRCRSSKLFLPQVRLCIQNVVNVNLFDGPMCVLNAKLEHAGAIVGALLISYGILDLPFPVCRTHGYLGVGIIVTLTVLVWAVMVLWQVTYMCKRCGSDMVNIARCCVLVGVLVLL
ncbi:hypothetical protein C8Q80DRAFT_1119796 [Daedaleopsis nitida]|nr:hypothetical protein C8Q80DRAFT_1119796 [Daedaleopsis nitida]